jgi:ribosomal 50S subunit-recycling heat shock protein
MRRKKAKKKIKQNKIKNKQQKSKKSKQVNKHKNLQVFLVTREITLDYSDCSVRHDSTWLIITFLVCCFPLHGIGGWK